MLHVDEYVSRDAGTECESFLGETAFNAESADSLPNFTATKFPRSNTFRIVLTGSRGHPSQ